MDKSISEIQNSIKYKSARTSLLILSVFSVLNIFFIIFGDMYFLFSSYTTQVLAFIGFEAYADGETVLTAVFIAISLLSVIPYLVCYFFSKKKIGWMIGALVLFSIDTLWFAYGLINVISIDFALIADCIWDIFFHAYALYALISCVVYGVKMKKNATDAEEDLSGSTYTSDITAEETRKITVTKKKESYGFALECVCCIDGKNMGTIKNGETKEFYIDDNAHTMVVVTSAGISTDAISIPNGFGDKSYEIKFKFNFFKGAIPTVTEM